MNNVNILIMTRWFLSYKLSSNTGELKYYLKFSCWFELLEPFKDKIQTLNLHENEVFPLLNWSSWQLCNELSNDT